MLSAEEIGTIAVFADLGEDERERLARAAADVRLLPGEYAATEGSDRALFAVVSGRIEAVKLTDGIERIVGERQAGRPTGARGRPAAAAGARRRPPPRRRLHKPAALPRPQPDHLHVADRRGAGRPGALGRAPAARSRLARLSRRRRRAGRPALV